MLLFFAFNFLSAQKQHNLKLDDKQDSLKLIEGQKKVIYSNARKASILSASLPGLGQAYNKKYWKIPIIYGVLGGITYWGVTNHQQYKFYSNNLTALHDENVSTKNTTGYTSEQLVTQKRFYKKYRDMAVMLGALAYFINIIDANVDAHLKTFDVGDDLSLKIKPYSAFDLNNQLHTGFTLHITYK